MAYNNPILQAVLGNQQAEMQNKQFETSLGLQIAQFADRKQNAQKDQDYRQAVLGEDIRQNSVTENAAADAVTLEKERYDGLKDQRAATLAGTKATTAFNNASTLAQDLKNQKELFKPAAGLFFQTMMNSDGTTKKFSDGPEVEEAFGAIINDPAVAKKILQGADGTIYRFAGAVDLGDGRRAIQIEDPNNPGKVMYMSKNRTAVEGDDLTAMDLMGFDLLKEKVSIAMHDAIGRPLSGDLKAIAEGMNAVNGVPKGTGLVLNNNTVQDSADLSQAIQADQQAQVTPAVAPAPAPADPDTKYADNWNSAVKASEKRMDLMREPIAQIDTRIAENKKRLEDVQTRVDAYGSKVPKSLQTQLTTLTKLGQRLDDRKAAGNDTFDEAQLAHNNLLDTKDYANGMAPMKNAKAKAKAAANIVKQGKIKPQQVKDPVLKAAVNAAIVANPPPAAQVQESILKPQKMTPALLYQLHVAQALGMIDDEAIARVADLGVLSKSGVEYIKQQMIEAGEITQTGMNNQTDLLKKAMDIAGTAATPYMTTAADGTLIALDKTTGEERWRVSDSTDGRSQADKTKIMRLHTSDDDGALDSEDSMMTLAREGTLMELPELEQNILGQHLQSHLIDELAITGIGSFIDWVRGSDEDDVHNQLQHVQNNFAYDPNTKEIMLFDAKGNQHGDRDYYLDNLDSDAIKLLITDKNLLKTPTQVQRAIKTRLKKKVDAQIAEIKRLQGIK